MRTWSPAGFSGASSPPPACNGRPSSRRTSGGLLCVVTNSESSTWRSLSNRKLAHRGPAALAEVLETESPELVEAHWKWTSSGALYDLPYFRAHYVPAFGGRTKLWLRRDVGEAIERNGRGCRVAVGRGDIQAALRAHRFAWTDLPEDRKSFEAPGTVVALNQGDGFAETLCIASSLAAAVERTGK